MRKKITPDSWLKDDQGQIEWTRSYLSKRGQPNAQNFDEPGRAGLLPHLRALIMKEEGRDLFRRMRGAWYQRCQKDRTDKNTYSFFLSTKTHRRLKELAGKTPLGQKLEELIGRDANFEEERRKTLRAEIQKKKAELEGKPDRLKGVKVRGLEGDLAKLRQELAEARSEHDKLLFDHCRQRIKLRAYGLLQEELTPEQEAKVQRLYKLRLQYHHNVRASGSSSHG